MEPQRGRNPAESATVEPRMMSQILEGATVEQEQNREGGGDLGIRTPPPSGLQYLHTGF